MCHYLKLDPWFRQDNHKDITFSMMYAFSENYVLPISHDEVVHMKGSVVGKMPGDYETQLQCTRGFYGYLLAHPGKKLLFMGAEIGQWNEWHSDKQLDWFLLEDNECNRQIHRFFQDANQFYKKTKELWEIDFSWEGFEWLVPDDNHNNVVIFLRKDRKGRELLCAINFSPNNYDNYRVGVPARKRFVPLFSTDAPKYGGHGFNDIDPVDVEFIPSHGKDTSLSIKIPAFGAVFLRGEGSLRKKKGEPEPKEEGASVTAEPAKAAEASKGEPEKEEKPAQAEPLKPEAAKAAEEPAEEEKPAQAEPLKPEAAKAAEEPAKEEKPAQAEPVKAEEPARTGKKAKKRR